MNLENDQNFKVLLMEGGGEKSPTIQQLFREIPPTLFHLICPSDLSEGFRVLFKEEIHIVLFDLDGFGYEALEKITEISAEVPVVVFSENNDPSHVLKAEQSGAQEFLSKIRLNPTLLVRTIFYATERRRVKADLAHLTHFDNLTNLPNRLLFLDRLSQAITRVSWHNRLVGVLFVDLDHFKRINDTLGHHTGDLLLKEVAGRISQCLREGDTVARLGGDEFGIILADIAQVEDVPMVSKKILNELSRPFFLGKHELFITTSIGISLFPNDAEEADILLKNADMAMYRAKERGRNNYNYYSPALETQAFEQMLMENNLRRALEKEELFLHYQPQVDIESGELIGIEALVRWQHPELGLIPPGKFIPLAEDIGLIIPIGKWVLQKACVQSKQWQNSGFPGVRIAVNLSLRQFQQKDLVQMVDAVLGEIGLSPSFLELELTESIMGNAEATAKTLCDLKAMGIQISIDDFGTGYSSLSYLKKFPIDKLKIDRSFVRDVSNQADGKAIVEAIITLAHSLKMKAIAEGVETEEQLHLLKALRCDEIQGYLVAPPLPAEEVVEFFTPGNRWKGTS